MRVIKDKSISQSVHVLILFQSILKFFLGWSNIWTYRVGDFNTQDVLLFHINDKKLPDWKNVRRKIFIWLSISAESDHKYLEEHHGLEVYGKGLHLIVEKET